MPLNISELGLNGTEDSGRGEDGENHPNKTYNSTIPRTGTHRNNEIFVTEISSQNNSFTAQTSSGDLTPLSEAVALHKYEF